MPTPPRLLEFFEHPGSVALDEALLYLAGTRPDATVDVASAMAQLDEWAAQVATHTVDGLRVAMYDDLGFRGDHLDYHDPLNSHLDAVMARRLGMPITLAVVLLALARRCDVALEAVGMPGHFLVRDPISEDYLDPFDRALPQPASALRQRMAVVGVEPSAAMLAPVDDRMIVLRVINNLTNSFMQRDQRSLDWLLDLRLELPPRYQDARGLAMLCERRGRYGDAARLLDRVASLDPDAERDSARRRAHALRSRLN